MLVILWPFLRPQSGDQSGDWTRQSLKAALAAVDKDEARGVLSSDAADAQRANIAHKASLTLNNDNENDANDRAQPKGKAAFFCVAIILVIAPVVLWGSYAHLGTVNPQAAETAAQSQLQREAALQSPLTLESAATEIKARLKDEPESGRLWAALGDVENRQGNYAEAEVAYEQAIRYSEDSSEDLARFWLILAMTRRTQGLPLSDPTVVDPLRKSLALDPSSPAAILLQRLESDAEDTP